MNYTTHEVGGAKSALFIELMIFGFISTRFAGTDGVSLESAKWAGVLEEMGHEVFWFAGMSDRPAEVTELFPEAHFEHPRIAAISDSIWGKTRIAAPLLDEVESLRVLLHEALRTFVRERRIDVLVPQNALTIPMNIPLGLALTDLIEETGLPTLAHHHDFYWERERFAGAGVQPWLDRAFPPALPSIAHVVINTAARRGLRARLGLEATVLPNVMDFSESAPLNDDYSVDLKSEIGLDDDDRLILQPTRIVPRKGIELAIDLVARLGDPRHKLVISHDSGDEGHDYLHLLQGLAREKGVDLRLISDRIKTRRGRGPQGEKLYTLQDLYPFADLVTFPSLYEGFGNALLEAIHFGKPVLVNRYSVFRDDIEPLGFDLISIDGEITDETVTAAKRVLDAPFDPAPNRKLAAEHFGYAVLRETLSRLLEDLQSSSTAAGSSTGAKGSPE